jgi:hypothetical protein
VLRDERVCVAAGFDTPPEINGPVIEIAGPTNVGYELLEGVTLPNPPFTVNIGPGSIPGRPYTPGGVGYESLAPEDKATIYALGSVQRLPIQTNSVGMVVCSAIDYFSPEHAEAIAREAARMAEEMGLGQAEATKLHIGLVQRAREAAHQEILKRPSPAETGGRIQPPDQSDPPCGRVCGQLCIPFSKRQWFRRPWAVAIT